DLILVRQVVAIGMLQRLRHMPGRQVEHPVDQQLFHVGALFRGRQLFTCRSRGLNTVVEQSGMPAVPVVSTSHAGDQAPLSELLPRPHGNREARAMKITDVKTTTLKGYKDWNYVRIETDAGISGLGEAYPGEGVTDVMEKRLKPLIVGKDPLDVEPLYHRMVAQTIGQSVGGTMLAGISGIETALWDLAGKALGVPAYRLLGGKYRDRIRLYADVGRGRGGVNTPEAWAARAREGVADGYQAIKFDIDHS